MNYDQYGNGRVLLYDASGNAILADSQGVRVSVYGKSSAAGDKPLLVDSNGRVQVVTPARTPGGPPSGFNNGVALMYGAGETTVAPLGVASLGYGGDDFGYELLRLAGTFKTLTAQAIVAAAGVTVWTPASGKKFRLLGFSLSSTAEAGLKFYDGVAGALTTLVFQTPVLAAGGVLTIESLGLGRLSAAANNTLALDVSGNSTISGTIWGVEE